MPIYVKLIEGEPNTAKITAPSAVVSGQIVNVGDTPLIAVHDAASGALANFYVGGGIFESTVANTTSGSEPTVGKPCYSDGTNIGDDTQGGKHLGIPVYRSSTTVRFLHQPNGTATS